MADRNVIIENFGSMGLRLPDAVVNKCVELCERYDLDETEMFEIWMATTVTNGEDPTPTVDRLHMMERRELMRNQSAANKKTHNAYQTYSRSSPPKREDLGERTFPLTPEVKRRVFAHSPGMGFTPNLVSPDAREVPKTYLERKNSGQVVCSYGDNVDSLVWSTKSIFSPHIEYGEEFEPMLDTMRYMYNTYVDKVHSSRKQSDLICLDIVKNHEIKLPLEIHHISMETATYAGKILCDGLGKLNSSSILLESCLYNKRGENVRLQVNNVPEYSIFPGQVMVVEGKNPDGSRIIAEKIYTDVRLKMYPPMMECFNLKEPMQIVVACGPYMLTNVSYKPFYDLIEYVVENKPHVLILIGPLIDVSHPNVVHSVDSFSDCYKKLTDSLMTSLKGTHTKVVMTSSWKEATYHTVYPTPPPPVKIRHPDLFLAPDPSILNISGFHIGLTASDIIMHLGKEELFCSTIGSGTQRVSRLASHIFQQKCFYPLKPPNQEMSVDPSLLVDLAQIPFKPHVMITPSDLRYFVNVISDSVFVNPERLAKNAGGGNFARIQVRPAAAGEEDWSPATHVSVQIVKI